MQKAILVGAVAVLHACQRVPAPRRDVPPVRPDTVLVDPRAKGNTADASVAGLPEADGDGSVKLIEPGAEPRVVRRYAFVAGKGATRVGQVRETVTIEATGPAPQEQTRPALDVTMRLSTEGDRGSGVFPFRATVEKVELAAGHGLDPRSATEARTWLRPFVGTTAKFEVTARGQVGELTFVGDGPSEKPGTAEVVDSLQQALSFVAVPLPEGPIGVGAKWETSSTSVALGVKVSTVTRFLLQEWTGDGGKVTAEIVRTAPRSPLRDPRMPGAQLRLTGEGRYTFLVKLDRPTQAMSGESRTVATVDVPQSDERPAQTIGQTIKTRHSLETPAGR